ncbi:MAG: hypothetical protein L7T19_08145 [Pseudomonadales bacterium]|nr:hypothetical protein [Pseudomonadales bacterium]
MLFTAGMANSGLEVTGCDIAPERNASAIEKANLDIVKCNIEHETFSFMTALILVTRTFMMDMRS